MAQAAAAAEAGSFPPGANVALRAGTSRRQAHPGHGVLTDDSLAYGVAELAQREGAQVVLTSFGRALSLTKTGGQAPARSPRRPGAGRDRPGARRDRRRRAAAAMGQRSTASSTRSALRRPPAWAEASWMRPGRTSPLPCRSLRTRSSR